MEIQTTNLVLVDVDWMDIEDIHRLHLYPEVDQFNTIGIPSNIEETKEIMRPVIERVAGEEQKYYAWKIRVKSTGRFIGLAGFSLSLDRFKSGEIYYKLLPAEWGKGYATEVSKALIRLGFETFKLHRIEAGVAVENKASIRVLEKSGMSKEGLNRKILPIRGEWVDNYQYAIVEDDSCEY